jgi:Outer membrane lipoprotein-sorting protein
LFQLAKFRSRAAILILALPMVYPMTGCMSLFTSKRKLPLPIAPASIQNSTADELVKQINDRWAKFESLTATVDIKASHLKTSEGTATDYPSFRSNLLLRKPEDLRILGKAPVVQTIIFDLASDGTNFTLLIPPKSLVYKGLNANKGTSPNWYENLRPGPIFSAMVVRAVPSDELYSVISESITEEDAANKRLYLHPEYEISFGRRKPDSQEVYPTRVLHIHREDLLVYEQDLYDDKGVLATQVIYGPYKDFDGFKYPSTITMKRPQEEYQLMMTVERVTSNPPLTDDQFQVKVPPEYTVRELK